MELDSTIQKSRKVNWSHASFLSVLLHSILKPLSIIFIRLLSTKVYKSTFLLIVGVFLLNIGLSEKVNLQPEFPSINVRER